MNNRIFLLVAAVVIVVVAVVVVRGKLNQMQSAAKPQQVESNRILVAKRDITPGKFVDSLNDLEWVEPTGDLSDTEVIREGKIKKSEFNGGIARRAVATGKPVAVDDITKAGDGGFLSAVLEPGMRAVSIAVNATTGAAGFIAPGDRVDLIVTHRIKTARSEVNEGDTVVSETFVRDVRVVAVDQSLNAPETKATLAKNVTVEVNENQAEQIAVANEMGKISLALRSSLTNAAGEVGVPQESTRSSDVISSLGRKDSVAPRVQVIRGGEKEDLQFLNQGGQR